MSEPLPPRQRDPIYCKGIEGVDVTPRLFVVDAYNRVPTFITDWGRLEICYNHATPSNSTGYSGGIVDISEEEFMQYMKHLEEKYGVKIFIKTAWGRNEDVRLELEPEPKIKKFVNFIRKKLSL